MKVRNVSQETIDLLKEEKASNRLFLRITNKCYTDEYGIRCYLKEWELRSLSVKGMEIMESDDGYRCLCRPAREEDIEYLKDKDKKRAMSYLKYFAVLGSDNRLSDCKVYA